MKNGHHFNLVICSYATFCFNNVVSEHFTGLIPIRKVLGSLLSIRNVMEVLGLFFIKQDISLWDMRFACMDTNNVNSGEDRDLKQHLEHKVPL